MRMRTPPQAIANAAASLMAGYVETGLSGDTLVAALKSFDPSMTKALSQIVKPLKMKETASLLGLSLPTVGRLIKNGHLSAIKLPGSHLIRVDPASLQNLLDGKATQPAMGSESTCTGAAL